MAGKKMIGLLLGGFIMLVLAGAVLMFLGGVGIFAKDGASKPFSLGADPSAKSTNLAEGCPDNLVHTLTYSLKNMLNLSGDETFDSAYRFTDNLGNVVAGTDSTAGSVALVCGRSYTLKQISSSGADGDSAILKSVVNGNAKINADKTATFTASGPSSSLILGGMQHGLLEFRAKDVVNDGYMFSNLAGDSDGSATAYSGDGISFNSTVGATAATAVGAGGEFHVQIEYRPTNPDNVGNDIGGQYVLVDAATTVWNVPTVMSNGVTLVDAKAQLNDDEKKAYSGYEYAYIVTRETTQMSQSILDFQQFALSGVNPGASDDIQIDFADRGAYASTMNSNLVKIGSVQDDTAQTVVHTLMDTVFDIS